MEGNNLFSESVHIHKKIHRKTEHTKLQKQESSPQINRKPFRGFQDNATEEPRGVFFNLVRTKYLLP